MFKKFSLIILGAMIVLNLAMAVNAQEEDAQETEFASGLVTAVTDASLTINESEEDLQIVFVLNDGTVLENIGSVNEVRVGDEVYVDYVDGPEGKAAVNIYKMGVDMENEDLGNTIEETLFEEPGDESEKE